MLFADFRAAFDRVATIIVRIKNQGESYRFNDFGQSIVVERSFSRNGTSGFKLKNVHGRIVSTRKADLDEITDYFALQIDNPVNVLSQDMARQFLGSSNKHEKYKFFVKGVQLEQLDNDYKLIEESLDHTNLKVTAYLEDFEIAKKELSNAKAKLDLSDRYLGLQSKIDGITAKMVWAHVFDEESVCLLTIFFFSFRFYCGLFTNIVFTHRVAMQFSKRSRSMNGPSPRQRTR